MRRPVSTPRGNFDRDVLLEAVVAGGVVGDAVLPAAPEDAGPGASDGSDCAGVVVSAAAGVGVSVLGPGVPFAGRVSEGARASGLDGPAGATASCAASLTATPDRGFTASANRQSSRAEGRISHLKRRYGLDRSRLKGDQGRQIWTEWAIVAYNTDTLAVRNRLNAQTRSIKANPSRPTTAAPPSTRACPFAVYLSASFSAASS